MSFSSFLCLDAWHANILFSFQSFKKFSLVGGIHLFHASKIVFWSSLHAANTLFSCFI